MIYTDPQLVRTLQGILEFLGTFAFAISGIRHAAQKHFDWFGGYVCGFAVAIGGGTIRDTMLGGCPIWQTQTFRETPVSPEAYGQDVDQCRSYLNK